MYIKILKFAKAILFWYGGGACVVFSIRGKAMQWIVLVCTWLGLWTIPTPADLDPQAWKLFGLFVPTILGIILKPMPMAPMCLLSFTIATFTGVIPLKVGLQGFHSPVVWLIVIVFFIARGFIKTGLGERIAYLFVRRLGHSSLGLGYGMALTELLIAPFVPSNTARAGGIIFPILQSINHVLESKPEDGTERKIGSFLVQVVFHCNLITSAMFLTAMAANPLAQAMAAKHGIEISWFLWFKAALVPGLLSLIIIPLGLYIFYPPTMKKLPQAVELANQKLIEMGPISKNEWIMMGIFFLMIALWMGEQRLHIPTAQTAFLGLSLLLLSGILTWKDVQGEHEAWNILVWISIVIMMSDLLSSYGFMDWFSHNMGSYVEGLSWQIAFLILAVVYFYSHYFFASNTAHVSAMYAAFLSISIAVGTPPMIAALVLGFFSNIFSCTTHYGTSPAVILFGTGYVPFVVWWGAGFIISLAYMVIWLGAGGLWWKALGLW